MIWSGTLILVLKITSVVYSQGCCYGRWSTPLLHLYVVNCFFSVCSEQTCGPCLLIGIPGCLPLLLSLAFCHPPELDWWGTCATQPANRPAAISGSAFKKPCKLDIWAAELTSVGLVKTLFAVRL